jgi:hypothetical protein
MSTKHRKNSETVYSGTIVPAVAMLINKCVANQKKYRLITEEQESDDNQADSDTLTIVVNKVTCSLVNSYWGKKRV